jgi:hypothetical protein
METAHQELGQTFSPDQNLRLTKKQVGRVTADVSFWPVADVVQYPLFCRYRVHSGRDADM